MLFHLTALLFHRILDSCTELMKLIKILITAATELQREIVAQGRVCASSKNVKSSLLLAVLHRSE